MIDVHNDVHSDGDDDDDDDDDDGAKKAAELVGVKVELLSVYLPQMRLDSFNCGAKNLLQKLELTVPTVSSYPNDTGPSSRLR